MKSRIPQYRLILLFVVLFAAAGCSELDLCFFAGGTYELTKRRLIVYVAARR